MHLHRLPVLLLACASLAPAADLLGDTPVPPTQPPPPQPPALRGREPGPDNAAGRMALIGIRNLIEQGKQEVRLFNADKARNATAIVDAAIDFAKARRLADGMADSELVADIQANLFWCKKQMDVDALKDYLARKGEDAKLGLAEMDAVAAMKPDPAEAKAYLARADAFAQAHADDPLQQAVRYLEVAERFPASPEGTEANKRSLAAQQALMKAMAESAAAARATRFTRPPAVGGGHLAIPDAAAQRDALKLLRKNFSKEYGQRAAADKRRLARKLFDDAPANKSDAGIFHAELSESVRLASECEDYIRVLDAIDRLGGAFESYDAAAEKAAALKKIGRPVALAIIKLLATPEDPQANLVAGKWFAFTARHWPEGLNMLARADDGTLAKVAQMELDKPVNAEEQILVGDAWYDIGKKAGNRDERNAMLGRAQSWYQQGAPGVSGLARTRIDQRMAEIEKQLPLDLEHIDWNALSASQWDKLKGTVVAVDAKHERTPTGIVLGAGQKVRVVPNPKDTWNFQLSYNQEKIECNWRGNDPRRKIGNTVYITFMGIANQPYGALLAWLDTGEKQLAGVVTGPGRLWVGPGTDRSWEADSGGSIRVKLIPVDDDD